MFENVEEFHKPALPVSREEFAAYVKVQVSGLTNMWHVSVVIELAEEYSEVVLTETQCFYIMKNYSELSEWYGITTETV